jgi:5S rRNA maturation endonuclease (ribonuclease M5)
VSTRLKEKLERIQQILTELIDESESGTLIVVEGKKDVTALRSLGLQSPVLSIKTGGKTFLQALSEIEQSGSSEVILLLDFDRRGKEATKYFKENLDLLRIKANLRYWKSLHGMVGREIRCVESLATYLENLQKKTI